MKLQLEDLYAAKRLMGVLSEVVDHQIDNAKNGRGKGEGWKQEGRSPEPDPRSSEGIQRFRFEVDQDGNFIYYGGTHWEYNGDAPVRIDSGSGKFTISAKPEESGLQEILAPSYRAYTSKGPWSEPLEAKWDAYWRVWYVQTQPAHDVPNSVPAAVRETLYRTQGYVNRFHYNIAVENPNGRPYIDDTRVGEYRC